MIKALECLDTCFCCDIVNNCNGPVPGTGNPNADIMFVGINPGKNEDVKREPFVGSSGKWLDRIINAIGYDREEVYISNIVKCLTPDNRIPMKTEYDFCKHWLDKEIDFVKPKLIIPLGKFATKHILGISYEEEVRMSSYRGQYVKIPKNNRNIAVYPLLHPATLVYNRTTNYPTYRADLINLIEIFISKGILESMNDNWKETFEF